MARIKVEQYHRMLETGILQDRDPIELLNGLLICKDRSARGEGWMTVGKRHGVAVKLLVRLDALLAPRAFQMQIQDPVTLPPEDEPEPDGAIVRGVPRDYLGRKPLATDVTCVIEVSDSSLEHDRTNKLAIYARAGIPQYVIVNLVDDQIEVFEVPLQGESRYVLAVTLRRGDILGLLLDAGARLDVPVGDLLP